MEQRGELSPRRPKPVAALFIADVDRIIGLTEREDPVVLIP